MLQDALFHEDFREALRHVVNALGGLKRVGCELNPALSPDRARTWLANCLDDNRPEKLDIEHIVAVLCMARANNIHSAFWFLATAVGYEQPRPVEPEDEHARLMREYIESVRIQARLAERMERVGSLHRLKPVG